MKYTKDNVTYEADTAEELVALVRAFESTREKDDGGWIKWGGGDCPVDGEVVYKMRNGITGGPHPARAFRWEHIGFPCDIIAYRVAKP